MAYVYKHIRLDKNETFYIGVGSDRGGRHTRAYRKHSRSRHWYNIVNKYGYRVEIIEDELRWEDALQREIYFISVYKRKSDGGVLVNLTLGGDGQLGISREAWNKGKPHSEEWRRKLKAARVGKVSNAKGKRWTVAARLRISKARKGMVAWNKGIPASAESKEKMRLSSLGQVAWNKGIPFSEASRKKMSESKKGKQPNHLVGRINTEEQIAKIVAKKIIPVYQFDLNGEFVAKYDRAKDAAEKTGLQEGSIRLSCQNRFGHRKTNIHGGFIWGYNKIAPNNGAINNTINCHAFANVTTSETVLLV